MLFETLIVDDEPIDRGVLREELEQFGEVRIVGEAKSGFEAMRLIETERPNLVFLDLQMPGMSGLDVVKHIGGLPNLPVFVVTTAYDQFAVQAFESGAIDYLLKPIGQERLAKAIVRAGRVLAETDGLDRRHDEFRRDVPGTLTTPAHAHPVRRILARSGPEYLLLGTDEVLAFQAEGDVVWIGTERHRDLATETLRAIQDKLRGSSFKRIHRKALVNINHIRKISLLTSQRWLLTLSNEIQFTVSKRQSKVIRGLWRF